MQDIVRDPNCDVIVSPRANSVKFGEPRDTIPKNMLQTIRLPWASRIPSHVNFNSVLQVKANSVS